MNTPSRPGRRMGWGLTGLVATVAAVAAGAPAASADIVALTINPAGQTYYVGTYYDLVATTDVGADVVSFYDNGACIGSKASNGNPEIPLAPVAAVSWLPSTAGRHVLTANDGKNTMTITLDVLSAPAGSTPGAPRPWQSGCGPIDRLLTGSA